MYSNQNQLKKNLKYLTITIIIFISIFLVLRYGNLTTRREVSPLIVPIKSEYQLSFKPTGITYDGENIWISSSAENRIFKKLGNSDLVIENLLVRAVKKFHTVIVMGNSARKYFEARKVEGCVVLPGGFDGEKYCIPKDKKAPVSDLILVGRLSKVKRVDIFLDILKILKNDFPAIALPVICASLVKLQGVVAVDLYDLVVTWKLKELLQHV